MVAGKGKHIKKEYIYIFFSEQKQLHFLGIIHKLRLFCHMTETNFKYYTPFNISIVIEQH